MKKNIGIASILFIIATLVLKVSGLGRDIVLAYYFGDGEEAGAFLAAFTISNMIFLLLQIGMKNSLVPTYIQSVKDGKGSHHLNHIFTGTMMIGFVISVLGIATANWFIPLMYPEFSQDAMTIAIWTTIIFFASLTFVGGNAVLEGYLDAENRFAFSVTSQIIVVFTSILATVLFAEELGIYSMAYGWLVGAILSLLIKFVMLKSKRLPRFKWKLDFLEVKDFYIIFVPVALTVMVGQINLTIDNIFAGFFDESVIVYVNYARHLVQFPQALIGVTIGTIIFPLLSKAKANDDTPLFKKGIEQGLTTMLFILAPALVGLTVLMPNLVELLFQRGEFSEEAARATTLAGYMYMGMIFFFSLQDVINKGFYTLKKGHLILLIGGVSIVFNTILNYVLSEMIGYLGIPLASSVMGALYVTTSFIIFTRLVGGLNLKTMGIEAAKVFAATAGMTVVILLVYPLIESLANLLIIMLISMIGAATYFVLALLLRTKTLPLLLNRVKKQQKS